VLRVAKSFLRFGSFEIFLPDDPTTGRSGPSKGLALEKVKLGGADETAEFLPAMLEYTIPTLFPEIHAACSQGAEAGSDVERKRTCYEAFLREVTKRTAKLVAYWQAVGFCHGMCSNHPSHFTCVRTME
jgi:uncharacterized protein YdiU (UPF0061 family)